jgi:hypothetical protein
MDLSTMMSWTSIAGAAFSTITTAYFWLVRMRGERANLKCEVVEREWILSNSTAEVRQLGLKLGLVTINGSTMPNALLEIRAWVQRADGSWLELEKISYDKSTPRPINLPPMHTAPITILGYLGFPYTVELEQGNKTVSAYLERFLTQPRRLRIELKGIGDARFQSEMNC